MRFFEIATPRLKLVATRRFIKNASSYFRSYSGVAKAFRDFIEFKNQNPKAQFSVKDTMFTGNDVLKNVMHCHLIHGKVIVVYRIIDGTMWLYDMVEHTAVENKAARNLGMFIQSLNRSDFAPYEPPQKMRGQVGEPRELEVRVVLEPEQMQELDGLFYEMVSQDRDVIDSAIAGDFRDIMEFMTLAVDEKPDTLLQVYGGAEGFKSHLQNILKQMGAA